MSLVRNLATVGSATLVSRVLGFVRDAGVAALLGAGPLADAYVAALQIPNLFRRLLADGAVNSAFVPAWLRLRNECWTGAARRVSAKRGSRRRWFLRSVLATVLCIVFAPAIVTIHRAGI